MANILTVQIIRNFIIFQQIFFTAINLKVSALTNSDEQQLCIGKHQIGLDDGFDIVYEEFEPIKFIDFDKIPSASFIKNNGHFLRIILSYNDTAPTIQVNFQSSLGVESIFRLEFLRFQWFKQVPQSLAYENLTFPAELHAVFYDVDEGDYYDAINQKKSILVLAFGIKVDPLQTDSFNVLQENLKYVQQLDARRKIENRNLEYWLKSDMEKFYAYEGSFVNFCYDGTVIWIDFIDTLTITPETVKEFRKLKANEVKPLMREISEMLKPEGKVFTNIETSLVLGYPPMPALTFDEKKNSAASRVIPGLLIIKQIGVLIMIYILFILN